LPARDVRWQNASSVEAYVPFRNGGTRAALITQVRSTMIVSAIQTLRARSLYDRYVQGLAGQARERIVSLVAGGWVPVSLALDHYRAVDGLGLDIDTIEAIGGEVADRMNKSVLSVAVKLSRQAGVTPWSALSMAHRINDINWRGGDIGVWKLGPKEALYEWTGQPCADVPYFVTSFGGFLHALGSLFSTKVYANVARNRCSPTAVSYRLSWI
jgi:hypothetical protein